MADDDAAVAMEDTPAGGVGGSPVATEPAEAEEEISNEQKSARIAVLEAMVETISSAWLRIPEEEEQKPAEERTATARLRAALAAGARGSASVRAFQKELRSAFSDGVEAHLIEERALDPLHARLVVAAGQPLGGTCPGVTAKGEGCSRLCLRLAGVSVGSCRTHRSQRPYHFSVGSTPLVSFSTCGVCGLAGGSEECLRCVFSGECYHQSCVDARCAALGCDLADLGPAVQVLLVSEVALDRRLIFQLFLNRHLVFSLEGAPDTVKFVVLPSRALAAGAIPDPAGLAAALRFVRSRGVEVFSRIEAGTESMSPGQQVAFRLKRSQRVKAKKAEDLRSAEDAQAALSALTLQQAETAAAAVEPRTDSPAPPPAVLQLPPIPTLEESLGVGLRPSTSAVHGGDGITTSHLPFGEPLAHGVGALSPPTAALTLTLPGEGKGLVPSNELTMQALPASSLPCPPSAEAVPPCPPTPGDDAGALGLKEKEISDPLFKTPGARATSPCARQTASSTSRSWWTWTRT